MLDFAIGLILKLHASVRFLKFDAEEHPQSSRSSAQSRELPRAVRLLTCAVRHEPLTSLSASSSSPGSSQHGCKNVKGAQGDEATRGIAGPRSENFRRQDARACFD